jgi:hypothetical protein
MALFIPRQQLQNMLDAEVGRALVNSPQTNIAKIVGLNSLLDHGFGCDDDDDDDGPWIVGPRL